ncbi:helix-turn-helix domain-containing protein [Thiomicrospira cyclica]|uniref:Helix-turn-helix domain protein n=1 Tax=Thiomicrospira cyclica (strain DSM 14477 / JCM 11371 / ALM1) TaxID=717773 RepID=F6DCN6_THICA|nr:helix-turn-helix transcriptional regulator [Thiomicrospira cyclica]AEG31622.1 helix-turn-helix domain protein [Thiomicrospira cyclica ALM1]
MKTIHSGSYKVAQLMLIQLRKNSGLTQSELAEYIGVDQSFISKIERGERRLDIVEFVLYCNSLKVSPAETIEILQQKVEDSSYE